MPYTLFGSSSDDYVTAVDAADDHMFVGGMINGQAQLYAGAISSDDVFGVHTAPDAFVLKLGSF